MEIHVSLCFSRNWRQTARPRESGGSETHYGRAEDGGLY